MAGLLDLRGVWRLLRGEALRERQAADRYGGFVKTINGTMRKESASAATPDLLSALSTALRRKHCTVLRSSDRLIIIVDCCHRWARS